MICQQKRKQNQAKMALESSQMPKMNSDDGVVMEAPRILFDRRTQSITMINEAFAVGRN